MNRRALVGADIFDGRTLGRGKALLLADETCLGITDARSIPVGFRIDHVDGGTLLPGFVDLQVNGGGGVMFNDATTVDGLRTIAAAHARAGTRALLPTLITDTAERTRMAVDAAERAIRDGVPGILGLHLEGPHLSVAKKGAHDPLLIRPMSDADEAFLLQAAARLPNLMLTVAPESVTNDRIARLAQAGVIVSLGHTDCTFAEAEAAFAAGASCVTHLFNAMRQIGSREPGLVGAALASQNVSAGLIADAVHVHPASMRLAITAKGDVGLFLVSDAMATAGSDLHEFLLNGRRVLRRDRRLTLEDGTLAGADLDIPTALLVLVDTLAVPRDRALRMATSAPAALLRDAMSFGTFAAGKPCIAIHLDAAGRYSALEDVATPAARA